MQELPGKVGTRVVFRNSCIAATILGTALRSCSPGTTLGFYTIKQELAFDRVTKVETQVVLSAASDNQMLEVWVGGVGGKGHHLSITSLTFSVIVACCH